MKTKYFYLAALASLTLASCSSDDFVGDLSPTTSQVTNETEAINFGFDLSNMTRADIAGPAAATLLGNNFYVTGTKGTEAEYNPTPTLVFDNYLVHYEANTAGTTESNTANWEYVGVTPGSGDYTNYAKLSDLNLQTIKYWDYSVPQYDFLAFSTGTYKAGATGNEDTKTIGVTKMLYGVNLSVDASVDGYEQPIAYTFDIPSVEAIKNAYISDITEVMKASYGKDVTLRFKNLGSKVRVALYETVPGYSVKDVVFYKVDGTNTFTDGDSNSDNDGDFKSPAAALISADANGLPTNGKIEVYFPHVGTHYEPGATNAAQDYNIAAAKVTSPTSSATYDKYKTFGALTAQLTGKDKDEANENVYLGRTLPTATFAGEAKESFYQTVFPVSDSDPLTLRVDYKLVPIDGAAETITVYGAKAVVPATYTVWLPNYAYTYVFKISDNTNGWTDPSGSDPAGLFPITFDAVVAEATDATAEQTTITTVSTPTITTYQQGHNPNSDGKFTPANEYSKATGKNVYVQVMDNNNTTSPTLVTTLTATNSLLYAVSDAKATEAQVMDALEKRTEVYSASATSITGRNGITLTKKNIDNTVTSIVNGVDNNPITVNAGEAAMIDILTTTGENVLAAGTYAYVYDYTATTTNRGTDYDVNEFQPIVLSSGGKVGTAGAGKSYKSLEIATLNTWANTASNFTTESTPGAGETVDNAYIYFSKTTNGTGTTTYSYVSVAGKTTVPAGLLKYPKASVTTSVSGGADGDTNHFYFDTYFVNKGSYAVKVIKIEN